MDLRKFSHATRAIAQCGRPGRPRQFCPSQGCSVCSNGNFGGNRQQAALLSFKGCLDMGLSTEKAVIRKSRDLSAATCGPVLRGENRCWNAPRRGNLHSSRAFRASQSSPDYDLPTPEARSHTRVSGRRDVAIQPCCHRKMGTRTRWRRSDTPRVVAPARTQAEIAR